MTRMTQKRFNVLTFARMKTKELADILRRERTLPADGYRRLLSEYDADLLDHIGGLARETAQAHFGSEIYIRGLIEVSNHCRNNCYYCGIRSGNTGVERYRMSKEDILACCRAGHGLGFRTFVLQGGEDAAMNEAFVTDLVRAIRAEFPDSAITLSLGEYSREAYQSFFDAGANRYLLRHETANREHYGKLHPASMSFERRMGSLRALKDIGYQTGTGIMVGSPGQTVDNIVEDILFIQGFEPEMIGIGPYLPQRDTPFADEPAGSLDRTLMLISIFRLMFPTALIPSTTSLATITPDGRERGILAGANVVMPNLSPSENRDKYALYDNKKAFGAEASEGLAELEAQLKKIGYTISYNRGDFKDANS